MTHTKNHWVAWYMELYPQCQGKPVVQLHNYLTGYIGIFGPDIGLTKKKTHMAKTTCG